METFETLHYKKGKDVLPLLFADIVAALCVACKHLSSPLPNSQSRQSKGIEYLSHLQYNIFEY